jgi:hypothetical protein
MILEIPSIPDGGQSRRKSRDFSELCQAHLKAFCLEQLQVLPEPLYRGRYHPADL